LGSHRNRIVLDSAKVPAAREEVSLMRLPTKLMAVFAALVAGAGAAGSADAQQLKQLPLSDKQITSFIAAQTDFEPLVVKLSEAADKPDDSLKAELDSVAKKHGFAGFDEYMDVNDNIAFVMGGLNRKSMEFTEPVERLKKDLEEIKADKEIPDEEKKLAIEDLTQEIAAAEPLKHKENVEVVKRHFAELLKLLPDEGEALPEGEKSAQ
jgi:adenine-specific DNA methylase